MVRFIFMLFVMHTLFAFQASADVQNVVDKIISINEQLQIINIQKDANKSVQNSQFSSVVSKKDKYIAQIPSLLINETNLKVVDKNEYDAKVKQLEYKISINQKAGYINAVARDTLSLKGLEASEIFQGCLNSIQAFSKSPTIKNTIKSKIDESLLALKTIILPNLPPKEASERKNDYPINQLTEDKISLEATINTYSEVLQYFKDNADLLNSNYIFSKLDIDHTINYINKIVPVKIKYINVGKIVFCLLTFGIFFLFATFMKRRKFLIFIAPFKKEPYEKEVKLSIIKSTNRPLIVLIYAIGVKLCFGILYHPYAIHPNIQTVFSIIFAMIVAWLIIGISQGYGIAFINNMTKGDSSFRKDVVNLILKIFYFIVITIAFLLILGYLGVNVSAIIASLGIGGLAVAWASKDILANFFASVLLLIDNSFSQGDWIVCGDVQGIVVEIGLRRTTIRTFDNALLFVPNSILANDPIRNWSRRKVGRRIKMSIGLTYDSPKDKIEACVNDIRQMLLTHPKIAKPTDTSLSPKDYKLSYKQHVVSISDLKGYKRTLMVYLDEFSSSSIDILIYCFSQTVMWDEWLSVKQDVMYKIIDIVEHYGLSFAFPSQSLYVENLPREKLNDILIEKSDKKES